MAEKRNNAVGPQISIATKRPDKNIQRAIVIAAYVSGLVSATQMFAHEFAYQDILGGSFKHLYAPWKIIEWSMQYYDDYPLQLKEQHLLGSYFRRG